MCEQHTSFSLHVVEASEELQVECGLAEHLLHEVANPFLATAYSLSRLLVLSTELPIVIERIIR